MLRRHNRVDPARDEDVHGQPYQGGSLPAGCSVAVSDIASRLRVSVTMYPITLNHMAVSLCRRPRYGMKIRPVPLYCSLSRPLSTKRTTQRLR